MAHTPKMYASEHRIEICDASTGHTVDAVAYCDSAERAAAIVTAVNGYETMREALAGIKWRSADKDNMEYTARITYAQMEAIDTALAKAKAMP